MFVFRISRVPWNEVLGSLVVVTSFLVLLIFFEGMETIKASMYACFRVQINVHVEDQKVLFIL